MSSISLSRCIVQTKRAFLLFCTLFHQIKKMTHAHTRTITFFFADKTHFCVKDSNTREGTGRKGEKKILNWISTFLESEIQFSVCLACVEHTSRVNDKRCLVAVIKKRYCRIQYAYAIILFQSIPKMSELKCNKKF